MVLTRDSFPASSSMTPQIHSLVYKRALEFLEMQGSSLIAIELLEFFFLKKRARQRRVRSCKKESKLQVVMATKLDIKDTGLLFLFGLLASVTLSLHYNGYSLAQIYASVARSIHEGLITLAIKFLHFFISRYLQFRYFSMVKPAASSTASMLFWVAFTRSISSMSSNTL